MSSSYYSAYSSALSSRTPSRESTPIPTHHHHQRRRGGFWRGFGIGGLTTAGLLGLIKLGMSYVKDYFPYVFHRKLTPTPVPTPTFTPTPTPTAMTLHYNRHF